MRISSTSYIYDPLHRTARRENPVPKRAREVAADKSGLSTAEKAAKKAGVGRIDWIKVIRLGGRLDGDRIKRTKEQSANIKAFKDKHDISSFLAQNAKTNKPRPTGRRGVIYGLSLSPHFYPNLLNIMHDAKSDALSDRFSKKVFNSFDGEKYETAAKASGVPAKELLTFCEGASPACRMTCLVYAGQNPATNQAPRAKMKLTWALLDNPELFVAGLFAELVDKSRAARCDGLDFVVRLNMLSDLPWYWMCPEMMLALSGVEVHGAQPSGVLGYFYDYSKRAFWLDDSFHDLNNQSVDPDEQPILDLTYSFNGRNDKNCEEAIRHGYRIAAVFAPADHERAGKSVSYRSTFAEILSAKDKAGKALVSFKASLPYINLFGHTVPLVDGDKSDYRMDDPAPSIVTLNFKAPNLSDEAKVRKDLADKRAKKGSAKAIADLEKKLEGAIEGIDDRTKRGRDKFAIALQDKDKEGARYAKIMASKEWRRITKTLTDAQLLEQQEMEAQGVEDVNPDGVYPQIKNLPAAEFLRLYDAEATPKQMADYADEHHSALFEPGNIRADGEVAAATAPMRMHQIGTTDILIGPHVPTVLED